MIREITGDIIEYFHKTEGAIIAHGCNCFHTMGAGVAAKIALEIPEAYKADLATEHGSIDKLGTFSQIEVNGKMVLNLYTQYFTGSNFEYLALIKCIKEIDLIARLSKDIFDAPLTVAFPRIGCGIGGGDWNVVKKILETYPTHFSVLIINYEKGKENVQDKT